MEWFASTPNYPPNSPQCQILKMVLGFFSRPILFHKLVMFSRGLQRGRTRAAIHCVHGVKHENLYESLGVSERGTTSEIKQAYKKLALKYHPDVSPPDQVAECTRKFIRVQEAYQTLSDPKTRAIYDRDLARGSRLDYSRRRSHHDQILLNPSSRKFEEWAEGRHWWESQLMELRRRSALKDSNRGDHEVPWGVGMGTQRSRRFYQGSNSL